jgi:pyrimidine operon attenuation protein/uracil phosphoribosyltransferase
MSEATPACQITGAQARGAEVAAALEKVATAVADAAAVVADLNVTLTRDRRNSESARSDEAVRRRGGDVPGPVSSYVDFEPELGFADWRCEVLSLLEAS